MKHEEYLKFHKEFTEKMHVIAYAKNKDYTGGGPLDDAFANLKLVQDLNLCSIEGGVVVRMCDKISRLCNFVKNGHLEVKDETIYDTAIDLANYSALLAAIIKEKSTDKEYRPLDYVQ